MAFARCCSDSKATSKSFSYFHLWIRRCLLLEWKLFANLETNFHWITKKIIMLSIQLFCDKKAFTLFQIFKTSFIRNNFIIYNRLIPFQPILNRKFITFSCRLSSVARKTCGIVEEINVCWFKLSICIFPQLDNKTYNFQPTISASSRWSH